MGYDKRMKRFYHEPHELVFRKLFLTFKSLEIRRGMKVSGNIEVRGRVVRGYSLWRL